MYKVISMSDADSESEYTDHPKSPILGRAQLPPKRQRAVRKRQKRKNNFQGIQRRRKYLCLGIAALVTLCLLVVFISINNNKRGNQHTPSKTPLKALKMAVLNWQSDEEPRSLSCTRSVMNTTQLKDTRSFDAVIINSTMSNVLSGLDFKYVDPNDSLIILGTNKPLQLNNISLIDFDLSFYDKIFSYSLKSDFIWQSHKILRKNDSRVMAPTLYPNWDAPKANFSSHTSRTFFYESVSESSPLSLAILNRPCQPARKELIERITQNMDVHTYGDCGEYSCGEGICEFIPNTRGNRTYKFFLAFEEELCEDYVSKNFFRALAGRLLPVVFGGANYTRFAPPNSYINARDFASIRELTEYLLYLDQNPEEHIKYFTWHDSYQILPNSFKLQTICDYLTNARDTHIALDTMKTRNTTIVNWLSENMCRPYELPEAWTTGASD
ncbi:alpha-(1,3)-fucosyltransferase fut-3 [Zeugodacus cucurbitae]|uniref:alpha-(1,3)-fucosyltransferase fut-3 n=1 Tax=Zeugodacus cucurbitae TaxID=28588 RepID=UPI0005968085|nr:alpha-(1,3)-fucosyltransferase fut-3 [Zeugodacus cucurbitae]